MDGVSFLWSRVWAPFAKRLWPVKVMERLIRISRGQDAQSSGVQQSSYCHQHSFCPSQKVKQKAGEVKCPRQHHGSRSTASGRGRESGSPASRVTVLSAALGQEQETDKARLRFLP